MPGRDDQWFEETFRANVDLVRRYARRRVPASDVDDITAEAFATAWRRRDDISEGSELPWLYRTCALLIANYRRKGVPTPVETVPELPDDLDPEMSALQDDLVRRVLGQMSPRDRQVLVLHAWEGLQGQQLAEVLGVSRGGADAALSRARSRLRELWADVQDSADV